jgi:phosphatidylglycerophosphatase C
MKQSIAFFDFDGTITTKDTLFEIIKFQKSKLYFYLGIVLNIVWLTAYTIGLLKSKVVKEKLLTFFFKNTSVKVFNQKCSDFCNTALPAIICPKMLQQIKALQDKGVKIVIVSGSATNWILPWAIRHNIDNVIATNLQTVNEHITGKIEGENCNGQEKVNRILALYNLSDYSKIYCFGNSIGDKPMLGLASLN